MLFATLETGRSYFQMRMRGDDKLSPARDVRLALVFRGHAVDLSSLAMFYFGGCAASCASLIPSLR